MTTTSTTTAVPCEPCPAVVYLRGPGDGLSMVTGTALSEGNNCTWSVFIDTFGTYIVTFVTGFYGSILYVPLVGDPVVVSTCASHDCVAEAVWTFNYSVEEV